MKESVARIVAEVLEVDASALLSGAMRENVPEWTSLAHLRVVTAVEREFGASFTLEEIASMDGVERIAKLVEGESA